MSQGADGDLVAQSCLTLCNSMDCSLPSSSVHRILQARILEWVTISFSRGSSQPRDRTQVSCTAGKFFTTEPPRKPSCCGWVVKNMSANVGDSGDVGSIPGSGRSPGEGNGNPLQYSCLNLMDRGAWQATVHRVAKSQIQLSD